MKKLFSLLLIVALLCLAACGSDEAVEDEFDYEAEATQLTEATTYRNEYLGVNYTLPSGWWLYESNPENFSTVEGTTGDALTLDILTSEGVSYMSFISFANLQHSNRDNHLGFQIDAEQIAGIETLEGYVEDYVAYMIEPVEGADDYVLLEQEPATVAGRDCVRVIFQVPQADQVDYHIMSLLFEMPNGYYVGVHANYWADNDSAVENILQAVESALSFS